MTLRLAHTLSLLLLAVIFAAVLAFGGLLAWNLRSGFNDYLASRDRERLEQFAALVSERLDSAGITTLTPQQLDLHDLFDAFAARQGLPRGPPNPPPVPGLKYGTAPPPPPGLPPPGSRPPGDFPLPPNATGAAPLAPGSGSEGFDSRVGIYAPDGHWLAGAPLDASGVHVLKSPIRIHGRLAGWVRMRVVKPVPDAVEAAFLRRQFLGIGLLGATLLTVGLVSARILAAWWVRPLLGVQQATARIARGDFAARLATERTDEIGDLIGNVNRMAEGLERLEGARRRWIADISHELRTPLTVLRGELDALMDGVRTLDTAAVASLREEALRLGTLVEDLHLLAMADLNALPCHFTDVDAVHIVQRVHARFSLRAAGLGLRLDIETPPGPLPVHWDGQRIEQLLGNLVDNSLRYTDAPGRLLLTAQRGNGRVILNLQDSPPGVPHDDLARLFEPLYRADVARSRHRGGSGLGLAIAAALARAHGGRMTASHSRLGGLCIRVDLPQRCA